MFYWRIPMNLQMFAADDGGDGGGGENNDPKPVSFDDFLKEGNNQAEYDSRVSKTVQKEVQKALNKAQKKWETLRNESVSEAEKLALMTPEEKAKYQSDKREAELAKREADLTRKELQSGAKSKLIDAGLPADLHTVLDYTDEEACDRSIETLKDAFQKAVEAAVEDKLKGKEPPATDPNKSGNKGNNTLDQQIYNAMKGW